MSLRYFTCFLGKPQAILLRCGNLQFDDILILGYYKIITYEAMSELLSENKVCLIFEKIGN